MMKKTTVDGKVVNQRTADMLALWQFNCLTDFYVVQGSYNAGGVVQSAGTHDGGGAVDLSEYGWSDEFTKLVVLEGRRCGWMAYHRPTLPGQWNEHIHAGALGDPEASYGLQQQFAEYRNGGDGLSGNSPDTGPRVRIHIYPNVPLKSLNLLVAWRQFRIKDPKPRMTVKRIQWVLNEKLGTNLVCDGVAGPKTREAYAAWEKKINSPKAEGVPGPASLRALGAGRFRVSVTTYEKWVKTHDNKRQQRDNEKKNPTFVKK